MSPRLRVAQLNMEGDKHLQRVLLFAASSECEVFCFQELRQSTIPLIEDALKAKCVFAPMNGKVSNGSREIEGVGIFSRLPIKQQILEYYWGTGDTNLNLDTTSAEAMHETESYVLIWCDIEKDGALFRIATTHFTWTPDGQANELQRQDLKQLLNKTRSVGEFVLCGDFNAPRGRETFSTLAEHFTDNIPSEYTFSIDPDLHRAGSLELMVDGIFSTDCYHVSNVKRICGLSDHCAFTAVIQKAS